MKTSWTKAAPLLALNVVFWLVYAAVTGVLWVVGVPLIRWAARKKRHLHEASKVWPGRLILRWSWQWMNLAWGNEQDGIDGIPLMPIADVQRQAWWAARWHQVGPDGEGGWLLKTIEPKIIFQWSALRNSTNNLRFMHYFVPWLGWINPKKIEPARIRWTGSDAPLDAVLLVRHVYTPGVDGERQDTGDVAFTHRFACLFVSQGLYAGLKIAVRFRGRAHQIWFGWKLNAGMAVEGWWPEDPCWKGVGFTCGQVRHSV